MSQQINIYDNKGFHVDENWIKKIIFMLVDEFDIRIKWDKNAAMISSACALVGGIIGYQWGKVTATIAAGVSGVTAYTVYTVVSLREVWEYVKNKLKELFYIVLNYLRKLNPEDYVLAYDMLQKCIVSRRELVGTILKVMVEKLGPVVLSNITCA